MKAVLVTGGSGGIGQAVVSELRKNGRRVAVADRREPAEADLFAMCDFEDRASVAQMMRYVESELGAVDSLVCCAAIYSATTLQATTLSDFTRYIKVNLEGPMAVMLAWLETWTFEKPATAVFVGSAAAHIGSRDPGYSASKAGLLGLVRSLALNLAERNVSIFSISPGVVDTPMSQNQGVERRDAHIARTMLKRAAMPTEIAPLIAWLLETNPHYMSGADFNISNGLYW